MSIRSQRRVKMVLDRPIPTGETTRFTFDDGVAVNVIDYAFAFGDTEGDGDPDLNDYSCLRDGARGAVTWRKWVPRPSPQAKGGGRVDHQYRCVGPPPLLRKDGAHTTIVFDQRALAGEPPYTALSYACAEAVRRLK